MNITRILFYIYHWIQCTLILAVSFYYLTYPTISKFEIFIILASYLYLVIKRFVRLEDQIDNLFRNRIYSDMLKTYLFVYFIITIGTSNWFMYCLYDYNRASIEVDSLINFFAINNIVLLLYVFYMTKKLFNIIDDKETKVETI